MYLGNIHVSEAILDYHMFICVKLRFISFICCANQPIRRSLKYVQSLKWIFLPTEEETFIEEEQSDSRAEATVYSLLKVQV